MDQPLDPRHLARRRQRTYAVVGAATIALFAGAWGFNRLVTPSVAREELRIVEVHRGAIADTDSAAGVVVPVHEEVVVAPARTRVARVLVKPGQVVQKGELLL
jgi:HlyD family secretion protein